MMRLKPRVATPVYSRDNPMPFEELLRKFAPSIKEMTLRVHKTDGTICVFPYCKDEHDIYHVKYKRIQINKEIK